jgi:hypothetical protein
MLLVGWWHYNCFKFIRYLLGLKAEEAPARSTKGHTRTGWNRDNIRNAPRFSVIFQVGTGQAISYKLQQHIVTVGLDGLIPEAEPWHKGAIDLWFKKDIQDGLPRAGSCNCVYSQLIWPDALWWEIGRAKVRQCQVQSSCTRQPGASSPGGTAIVLMAEDSRDGEA